NPALCLALHDSVAHRPVTTPIYTLSLHDALPIYPQAVRHLDDIDPIKERLVVPVVAECLPLALIGVRQHDAIKRNRAHAFSGVRSEEHTSELQSRENLVCRLLLEKKKNK